MASENVDIPQEGTSRPATGESLVESADSVHRNTESADCRCPISNSGGGNTCQMSQKGSNSNRPGYSKSTLPIVQLHHFKPVTYSKSGDLTDAEGTDTSLGSIGSSTRSERSLRPIKRRLPNIEYLPNAKRLDQTETGKDKSAEEDAVDDSTEPVLTRAKKGLPKPEDLRKEMRLQQTTELGLTISECLTTIEKVADKSRNLKGTFVRSLRVAVRTVQAASSEIMQRTTSDLEVARLAKENSDLRKQLSDLQAKVDYLSAEIRSLNHNNTLQCDIGNGNINKSGEDEIMNRIASKIDEEISRKLADIRTEISLKEVTVQPKRKKGKKQNNREVVQNQETSPPLESAMLMAKSVETQVSTDPANETWSTVVGRKSKIGTKSVSAAPVAPREQIKNKKNPKRPRNTAVVTVTVPQDAHTTYGEVMKTARQRVSLTKCGIESLRQRRSLNGGLILEVSGSDCSAKADKLAAQMSEALANTGVRIARPVKMGEIRILDLDDSITQSEIAIAIAETCDCSAEDIKVGEIRLGPSRMKTAWVRCPLIAVHKLENAKRIQIDKWAVARVEVLASRPLQCFRCLEFGHVRQQCSNPVDRSGRCYACGESGHKANQCNAAYNCPLCADLGRQANHRLGSKNCAPPPKTKRRDRKNDVIIDEAGHANTQNLTGNSSQEEGNKA